MADGSVRIDVGMNLDKANKDLEKLKEKIRKTEEELNTKEDRKSAIEQEMEAADKRLDATRNKIKQLKEELASAGLRSEKAALKERLADLNANYRDAVRDQDVRAREYEKLSTDIEKGTQDLTEMQTEAGNLEQALAEAVPDESFGDAFEDAKEKLKKFAIAATGIATAAALFKKLKDYTVGAVKAFAEYDEETKANIDGLKNALETLRVSWGAAFAPIFNLVAPLLQKLIGWLIDAANAVARFIAVLSGKTSFKRVVANTASVAQGLDNVAEAAQEAQRQLMGFDELNVLSAPGGGGGAGNGSNNGSPGYSFVEEAIDAFDGSFLNNLALSVRDVLFDWSDLNPEQIAEKIIAGLGAVLGAALGISLGLGAGGILTLTITGLVIGLVADAIIFDHDGQISPEEIKAMIRMAIMGLIGGVAGLAVGGGLPGAILGFTIGVSLSLVFTALEKKISTEGITVGEFGELVELALAGLVGGIVGMMLIPGFGGAFIGASLAIGLKLLFDKDDTDASEFGPGVKNTLIDSITSTDFAELHNILMYKIDKDVFGEKWANFWWSHGDYAGKDIIMGLINGTDQSMPQAEESMNTAGDETGQSYEKGLDGWAESAKESLPAKVFGWISGKVKEVLGLNDGTPGGMNEAGKQTGEGYATGLSAWADTAGQSAIVMVFQKIVNAVKSFLGIASPSTVFAEIGEYTMEGYKDGVESKWQEVENFFTTSLETIKTKFTEAWENLKQTTQTTWENIKSSTESTWENIKSNLSSKWENIKSAVSTAWENIKQKISGTNNQIENDTATQASKIREKTTKEYETMRNSVQNTISQMQNHMNTAWGTIKTTTIQHVQQMTQRVEQMFQEMYNQLSANVEQIKGLLDFEWSIPRPKIPVITWYYNYVQSGDGSTFAIPQFNVHWAAKGGIFDVATLIGVGEDGKEAVVPLEKNTEWINLVADGLMESLKRRDFASQIAESMASVPLPALAGGGIAPPNAFSSHYGAGWGDTLMAELKALKEEISALSRRPIEVDTKMYIDRREIGRAASTYQREMERTWG